MKATQAALELANNPTSGDDEKRLVERRLADAIEYMSKRWSKAVLFLDDPRLPLDNNAGERAIRGLVLGRKNHYGSKSRRGTEVAAVFYTLIESAKLAGVEPAAYLKRAAESG